MAKKKETKAKQEPDLNPAAKLPIEFPEEAPPGHVDNVDCHSVVASKEALMVGEILGRLSKTEVDTLYKVLAPLTKKMGWYASRYWSMQEKIRYLNEENKRILKKCMGYEERFNIAAEAREHLKPRKSDEEDGT